VLDAREGIANKGKDHAVLILWQFALAVTVPTPHPHPVTGGRFVSSANTVA
jgi:hypothetical protein